MPRMQVYLPDDLYEFVKSRGLSASELLQRAVASERRRLAILAETEHYVSQLTLRVGEPTVRERARANSVAERIARRKRTGRKAG